MSLLSDDLYKELHYTGSNPGIMYGSSKTYKRDFATNFSFTPIFAAYNTASYKLSKNFVPIPAPFTINDYTVENIIIISFASEICNKTNWYLLTKLTNEIF